MKDLKAFAMILGCTAAMCFTSCMDDEETGLTPQEAKTAYETVKGSYNGELYYAKVTTDQKAKIDTMAIQWSIDSDSIMTIKKFPSVLLAYNITDSIIRKTVAEAEDQDIKCHIGFYSISPIKFLVNPFSRTYNVNCEGKEHKIKIAFFLNSVYSFGMYSSSDNILQIQIVEGGIYVDGQLQSNLLKAQPAFVLKAKKK